MTTDLRGALLKSDAVHGLSSSKAAARLKKALAVFNGLGSGSNPKPVGLDVPDLHGVCVSAAAAAL